MNTSSTPTYKEIQGQFELQQRFGQGSYGEVFKAMHKKTGKIVAIKKVFKGAQNIVKHMPEIKAMKGCTSPYILAYYGCEWLREDLLVRSPLIFSPRNPKIASRVLRTHAHQGRSPTTFVHTTRETIYFFSASVELTAPKRLFGSLFAICRSPIFLLGILGRSPATAAKRSLTPLTRGFGMRRASLVFLFFFLFSPGCFLAWTPHCGGTPPGSFSTVGIPTPKKNKLASEASACL